MISLINHLSQWGRNEVVMINMINPDCMYVILVTHEQSRCLDSVYQNVLVPKIPKANMKIKFDPSPRGMKQPATSTVAGWGRGRVMRPVHTPQLKH